jgi:hypothetical protein
LIEQVIDERHASEIATQSTVVDQLKRVAHAGSRFAVRD